MAVNDSGFHPSQQATHFLSSGGGGGGGGLFGGLFDGLGGFLGSDKFKNFSSGIGDIGSLALGAYGLNKSLGIAEDQLGLQKDQENRAATAQNFQTGNNLSLALQATTPGSPERARIEQAIAQGSYSV
jgi:hypothetical protein